MNRCNTSIFWLLGRGRGFIYYGIEEGRSFLFCFFFVFFFWGGGRLELERGTSDSKEALVGTLKGAANICMF